MYCISHVRRTVAARAARPTHRHINVTGDGVRRRGELIRAQLGARGLDESGLLIGRQRKLAGQALGQLIRGAALVGLDLLERAERAADLARKLILS